MIPQKKKIAYGRADSYESDIPYRSIFELDVLRTTPGPASTGHLGLVEADDGFRAKALS